MANRGSPRNVYLVVLEAEEYGVTDDVPVEVADDKLLPAAASERLEAVDAEIREKALRVGALDIDVRHVQREIEQRDALPPRLLLVEPVGKLGLDRKYVCPGLRIAHHLDGVVEALQLAFEALGDH